MRLFAATLLAGIVAFPIVQSQAQTEAAGVAAGTAAETPEPLTAEEMEILVARIALYPDELVAVISAASLYPLQIVEAQRFLDDSKTKKDLKPKAAWDGSVVSLLNYPEVVQMMSDDLDWTQMLGEAIVNQQDDVLAAIQQLRDRAVAANVIKSDEKVKVVKENDNIVIQPASREVIYVPQYEPAMLYDPEPVYAPVTYYPDPYPYYYDPGAAFFAGAVTGVIWGAVVDWDDGFWGGGWDWDNDWGHGDIDIDCNKCIIGNDFSGKLNIKDVDWRNVDRSKINFNKNNFNKIDNSKFKNSFKNNDRNRVKNKATNIKGNRPTTLPGKGNRPTKDIRASTLEGLNKKPGNAVARPGQGAGDKMARPAQNTSNKRPEGGKIDRPVGKPKAAAKADKRPRKPSPMGEMKPGKVEKRISDRGAKSMGGGIKKPNIGGGGGGGKVKKRPLPKGGGGGRGGRGRR